MPKPSNYYKWIKTNDILEHTRQLWEREGWSIRDSDGKLHMTNPQKAIETPWHYIQIDWRVDCYKNFHVMHEVMCKRLPPNLVFVPSECQDCYKVVVRPQTLKQLFALEDLMCTIGAPCKCGIETREAVPALYGGYFYNRGIAEGLNRLDQVRKMVAENSDLGTDIEVFLKRGCTEMERECGPSDKWQITKEQMVIEDLVKKFVHVEGYDLQPESVLIHTHAKWFKFAAKFDPISAAEYNEGKPIHPDYVKYEPAAGVLKTTEARLMAGFEQQIGYDEFFCDEWWLQFAGPFSESLRDREQPDAP